MNEKRDGNKTKNKEIRIGICIKTWLKKRDKRIN